MQEHSSIFDTLFKYKKIIFITLLSYFLLSSTVYTIESGKAGVLSTWGEYKEDTIEPGIHFKIPIMQRIIELDVKAQVANFVGKRDLPDPDGIINKPMIKVLDIKNLEIGIELSIIYSLDKTRVSRIHSTYGKYYFDKKINPSIRDVVRDVIGKYQAEKIAKDRSAISSEIEIRLRELLKGTDFILNQVSLRDIKLPETVKNKIEEVQMAKQEEQRLEMVENQARMQQKIETTIANTNLIKITTNAKANAKKVILASDAIAYKTLKEAEAVAKANLLINKSITSKLIQYKSIERWSGEYPKMLMTGGENQSIINLPKLSD